MVISVSCLRKLIYSNTASKNASTTEHHNKNQNKPCNPGIGMEYSSEQFGTLESDIFYIYLSFWIAENIDFCSITIRKNKQSIVL